jgi:hypothetical protein
MGAVVGLDVGERAFGVLVGPLSYPSLERLVEPEGVFVVVGRLVIELSVGVSIDLVDPFVGLDVGDLDDGPVAGSLVGPDVRALVLGSVAGETVVRLFVGPLVEANDGPLVSPDVGEVVRGPLVGPTERPDVGDVVSGVLVELVGVALVVVGPVVRLSVGPADGDSVELIGRLVGPDVREFVVGTAVGALVGPSVGEGVVVPVVGLLVGPAATGVPVGKSVRIVGIAVTNEGSSD